MRTDVIVAKKLIVQGKEQAILQAILHEEIPAESILDLLDIRYSDDKLTLNVIKALIAKRLPFDAENISNEYYLQLASNKSSKKEIEKKHSYLMEQYNEFNLDKSLLKQALSAYSIDYAAVKNSQLDENKTEQIQADINLTAICTASPISKFSAEMAKIAKMPINTTFLTTLTVFSALCSRFARVSYRDGKTVPTSLYACTEQPSGGGKSRILNAAKDPILLLSEKDESKIVKEITFQEDELASTEDKVKKEELKKQIINLERLYLGLFRIYTDVTPEALDASLKSSKGFFCLASSEQAAINTILGLSYKTDGNSNRDLLLNGYVGDSHSSLRIGRQCYAGIVVGSVCVIAQNGVIANILNASGFTGLAERFIFWIEGHNLGRRNHMDHHKIDPKINDAYNKAVVNIYKSIDFTKNYSDLSSLSLSSRAWRKIDELKQSYESSLADGAENSANVLRGIINKIDMLVMKVSSVLHLSIDPKNMLVHDDRVDEAIQLAQAYIAHLKTLIRDSVVQALSDRDTAILDLLNKKSLTGKQIADKLYRKVCFQSSGKMSRKFVEAAVDKLVERDLVTVVKNSQSFNDRIFSKC